MLIWRRKCCCHRNRSKQQLFSNCKYSWRTYLWKCLRRSKYFCCIRKNRYQYWNKCSSNNNLTETSINIGGTVFGGGEANAAGDENYDFSFISVTGAINIDIDGLGYLDNNHEFILSGSIFGSGNASSSSGTSEIYIANLGTRVIQVKIFQFKEQIVLY